MGIPSRERELVMATWRKLHTKVTESWDFQDMPDDFTRVLWLLLPLALDKEGRGLDSSAWIRSKLMPLRDNTTDKILSAMDWYAEHRMIVRYEHEQHKYFFVPTWKDYQSTDREADSHLPDPLMSNSNITRELVMSNSSLDKIRKEENRLEEIREEEEEEIEDVPVLLIQEKDKGMDVDETLRYQWSIFKEDMPDNVRVNYASKCTPIIRDGRIVLLCESEEIAEYARSRWHAALSKAFYSQDVGVESEG